MARRASSPGTRRRCEPKPIPATQGASILDGVINWTKIRAHRAAFLLSESLKGNPAPDWGAEFRRFTADKRNYQNSLCAKQHRGRFL